MIKIKNNLFYIFLAFISIITASNAQTYIKTQILYKGNYLYDIKESVIDMKYNPPQPKCNGAEGNVYQNRLWVTTNETETNPYLITKINNVGMKLHIYHPKVIVGRTASESPLPVIVFGYGGGFLNPYTILNSGFGADTAIQKWFAERGFIVVAPEYRIGINLFDVELSRRAVWRAVQDIRKVIRKSKYLNTTDYSVDRSKPVTYVGYSSGAFIGLHNLYLNESNRPESTKAGFVVESNIWYKEGGYMQLPFMTYDLGTLDEPEGGATTDTDMSNQTVQDITVAISGAIGDINWISTKTNPKPKALYLIHHPEDGVVPYNSGFAYKNFELFNSKKFVYPKVFGSNVINNMYQGG